MVFIGLWSNGKYSFAIHQNGDKIVVDRVSVSASLTGFKLDYVFQRLEFDVGLVDGIEEIAKLCIAAIEK